MPCHGICLVYADPKIGKSIMMMQLCKAISEGTDFLGFKTHQKKVLYVQADEVAQEWAEQIKMTGLGNDLWRTVIVDPMMMEDPVKTQDLRDTVRLEGYNFIIYDSVSSLFAGDINSPAAAKTAVNKLRTIWNGPSMLIHHKTKGQQGVPRSSHTSAAGSYVWGAQTSTMYDLEPQKLRARGRCVYREIALSRGPGGIWAPKKAAPSQGAPTWATII